MTRWSTKVVVVLLLAALPMLAGCGGKDEGKKGEAKDAAAEEKLLQGLTPEQAAEVVAKVGDRTITVGEVTDQINRLSPYIRRRWAAPEKRKEFLQKLIRVELLSQEAERQGLGDDPEVQRTIKQVMIRLMVKNDLEKNVLPTAVDEAQLKAEYDREVDKYRRPAQVRASQIVVATAAQAEKLIAELKAKGDDRKLFRDKAKELSTDTQTKERGGDLGYFSKPAERREDEPVVPKAVAEAAWALKKVGDIADKPVKTEAGFHVVKLTNQKPEMNRSFESVKKLIENRLLRDKRREAMDKFIADLRAKSKIEIYEENLAKLKVEAPGPSGEAEAAPPGLGDPRDPMGDMAGNEEAPAPAPQPKPAE
jgi:peptidyl-prolyl cis-trans isomerase C